MRLCRMLMSVATKSASVNKQDSLRQLVDHYSLFNPSPMSIKQFVEFGRSMETQGREMCARTSFEYLRKELPVRLANIMKEIELLPEALLRQSSTEIVRHWYMQSFEDVLKFEDADGNDAAVVKKFTEDILKIRNRHAFVVETMAQGVIEMRTGMESDVDGATRNSIQYFLDRFYMMRISIRMLINQHTILFGEEKAINVSHIGTIDPECDVRAVVDDAFLNARSLCETYYERAPELTVQSINVVDQDDHPKIVYVPSHLYHISFELFKNAMRAVCEYHADKVLPPLSVIIVKSAEDVAIKMSDQGGGICQKNMSKLFEYMFSTAPPPVERDTNMGGPGVVPMAGYGYGLPLSRLYARYFHGDLQLYSMHGYGTDAIIYLKTLSESAAELLPVFNKSVLRQYKTARAHGWSSTNSRFAHQVEWG